MGINLPVMKIAEKLKQFVLNKFHAGNNSHRIIFPN